MKARLIKAVHVERSTDKDPYLLLQVKAMIPIKELKGPVLKRLESSEKNQEKGVLEFDLLAEDKTEIAGETEIELNWVIESNSLPDWVKAIKINGMENFNIEIIK